MFEGIKRTYQKWYVSVHIARAKHYQELCRKHLKNVVDAEPGVDVVVELGHFHSAKIKRDKYFKRLDRFISKIKDKDAT